METYIVHPDKLQEKALRAFLKALGVPFEKKKADESFPSHVLTGIEKGQSDIKSGRSITLDEFKQKIS